MKRLLLFIATIALVGCAQGTELKDLTFLGIPIAQSTDDFNDHLEANGYEERDGFFAMKGEYIVDVNGVECVVEHDVWPDEGPIEEYYLTVRTSADANWVVLERDYNALKEYFTKQFGKPTSVVEEWGESVPATNDERIDALRSGQATFQTTWEAFIDEAQTQGCGVSISIMDGPFYVRVDFFQSAE